MSGKQGCQMVYFQNKNTDLGKLWSDFDWKLLIYFNVICNIVWTFGILYDHFVHFMLIWYIFSGFGIMHQEKSGNPAGKHFATGLILMHIFARSLPVTRTLGVVTDKIHI
jgi:hypothetical protein